MERFLKFGFVIAVVVSLMTVQYAAASSAQNVSEIKKAIAEYKKGNYLGCISNLRIYLEDDPSNVVAWYYLGNSYMKISMKEEAHEAFDRVVQINSVPKLTSYSIQAKMCMENKEQCKYQEFTNEEIRELRANPAEFLTEYFVKSKTGETKNKDTVEIEKLINGGYGNIHPEAQNFIMQQKTQAKQSQLNTLPNKAYVPKDEKSARDILLMRQRQNQDLSAMAMFLDNNFEEYNTGSSTKLIEAYQNGNVKITPEMIKYSMMQDMLPNF